MSNVTLFEQTVPDYLKEVEMDEMTRRYAGGSGGKRISIRGRVFRLVVNGKEVSKNENNAMNVVIVAGGKDIARYFHAKKYTPGDTAPPDCFSNDGVTPDQTASAPQSNTCETCPQNIKGSGEGQSRACRFQQRLAVVLAEYIDGDVYELALPSKSIFGRSEQLDKMPFQQYARYVGSQGRNLNTLVTEMRFDTDSDTPKLVFKPIRYLSRDEWVEAKKQAERPEARNALKIIVSPQTKKAEALSAPAVEEAPEPEPVKRTAKKNAEPAPAPAKKGFTDVISSWSTDDE